MTDESGLAKVEQQRDRPGVSTFGAKDFQLGLVSMHEARIARIPESDQFCIDLIKREGLNLVNSVRATYESVDSNEAPPRVIEPMIDMLGVVSDAIGFSELRGSFDINDFVVYLAGDVADKIAHLRAAKELGYTRPNRPPEYSDAFEQINDAFITAVKNSWNSRQGRESAWDEEVEKMRQLNLGEIRHRMDIRKAVVPPVQS